jgi:deazaflavin-dependent oxidoreductase (nitroreductase family)
VPNEPEQHRQTTPRTYRNSRARRLGDAVTGFFIRLGVVPHSYMLTTTGRRTGRRRTVPVTLVEQDDKRWLVAPYGPRGWVHNARAAGQVTVSRRGRATTYAVRELDPEEAAPILKAYLTVAKPTRPYFRAHHDAPVAEFALEADRHPVFELVETA